MVTCAPALTSCVTMSRCPPQLAACSAVLSQRSLRPSSSALLAVLSSAATQAGWLCWAAAQVLLSVAGVLLSTAHQGREGCGPPCPSRGGWPRPPPAAAARPRVRCSRVTYYSPLRNILAKYDSPGGGGQQRRQSLPVAPLETAGAVPQQQRHNLGVAVTWESTQDIALLEMSTGCQLGPFPC